MKESSKHKKDDHKGEQAATATNKSDDRSTTAAPKEKDKAPENSKSKGNLPKE